MEEAIRTDPVTHEEVEEVRSAEIDVYALDVPDAQESLELSMQACDCGYSITFGSETGAITDFAPIDCQ